jgi:thiamine biosynthesis protein ThiS
MVIQVNGRSENMEEGITLGDYLKNKGIDKRSVVAELNRSIVPKEEYDSCVLKEKDSLEILRFVGGG